MQPLLKSWLQLGFFDKICFRKIISNVIKYVPSEVLLPPAKEVWGKVIVYRSVILLTGGSLYDVTSCPAPCPMFFLGRKVSVHGPMFLLGVPLQGVSVRGSLLEVSVQGSLSRGVSVWVSLSMGSLSGWYASYWNTFCTCFC